MANADAEKLAEIGMIGLGIMGKNFLLNLADHGFQVAGYDNDIKKVNALGEESKQKKIHYSTDIKDFIGLLRQPRAVMMQVPAEQVVYIEDMQIKGYASTSAELGSMGLKINQ